MKTRQMLVFLAAVIFLFNGCTAVKVALYNKDIHYPATDPQSIEVFQKKPEGRQFTEIGEITVDGASGWTEVERIFRIRAAELGGNAVYAYKITENPVTYTYPHECHYYEGFYYPHGDYYPFAHYHSYGRRYFPRYYYCYGFNRNETTVFLTVVGIVIRYT